MWKQYKRQVQICIFDFNFLSTCQGYLYNCRDVVGTCIKQANVQNFSWWNPKPTQKYARFGLYAFRDDMDDRSKICKSASNVVFFRKCTDRRMNVHNTPWTNSNTRQILVNFGLVYKSHDYDDYINNRSTLLLICFKLYLYISINKTGKCTPNLMNKPCD